MDRQIVWKIFAEDRPIAGEIRSLEAAHDLHKPPMRLTNLVEAAYDLSRESPMWQVMRQVGVVIGLTVILTFPVTLVSGAGSQKRSGHIVTTSPKQQTILAQAERMAEHDHGSGGLRRAPLR